MTVLQQQCLLAYLGYSPGVIDGKAGSNTTSAIKSFQQDYSLTADGICGNQTEKMLIGVVSGTVAKAEKQAISDNVSDNVSDNGSPKTGTFWDSIRYFRREEFRCKCGGKYCNGFPAEPDRQLVELCDRIRSKIGKPLNINSGLRCPTWNQMQGGVATSNHQKGIAADLSGAAPAELKSAAESIMGNTGGLGLYNWGIHVDVGNYSRWNG